ncbi:multicopper oxidase family protein [Hyphomicrobium sp.]|uniref:multicopper oxidase family protein n=1 Tax=Hyphomicrobium sp. TaxID=82 RepID=UPI000FA213E1|nr:multicopper oxidase family protein [Hyphomicrobium sp.]RUO99769.1 MAG: multicopper oxidase family protein [Hyphomicrobium sp.]
MVTRRDLMFGAAAFAGSAGAGFLSVGRPVAAREVIAEPIAHGVKSIAFDLAERPTSLPCFNGRTLPLWTFELATTFPIVRVKLGERLDTVFRNNLPREGEVASIHWHGLRIPNTQDGVPYMTQQPIPPGGEGRYSFVPPDTGSFFFHTHCNSVEHFGRGLMGTLIVEGDEITPADGEIVLMMKDWRIGPDGKFLPFSTDEGAAKSGTAGTVRSVNGATSPVISVPSAANVRIRFYNLDPMRISEIGFEDAQAAIIALDGNGVPPMPLESWRLGTAMRVDILLRTAAPGGSIKLYDYFSAEPFVLAEFKSEGPPKRTDAFVPTPLKVMPFAKLDEANAQLIPFEFSATPTGAAVAAIGAGPGIEIGPLCLAKRTFWAINKQAWPGRDHRDLGPPLAVLKAGQSYIFELNNTTPRAHPIHIHGHTFEVLNSSKRDLPRFRCDTILLIPNERIQVGLVAGEPGKWMFHCHILEHQEAGMMGYIEVV